MLVLGLWHQIYRSERKHSMPKANQPRSCRSAEEWEGEFTFLVKLKTHIGGPLLLWYWREGQISNDLVRNTWTTPENQPDFSSSCIRIELLLAWQKKIQSTTRKHETFEHMSSLRFGGSCSYKKRVFFQCISPFGFGGLILIQKKYSRNCHPHFLLNCCVAFAKLSLFQQKTPQSTVFPLSMSLLTPFWLSCRKMLLPRLIFL